MLRADVRVGSRRTFRVASVRAVTRLCSTLSCHTPWPSTLSCALMHMLPYARDSLHTHTCDRRAARRQVVESARIPPSRGSRRGGCWRRASGAGRTPGRSELPVSARLQRAAGTQQSWAAGAGWRFGRMAGEPGGDLFGSESISAQACLVVYVC